MGLRAYLSRRVVMPQGIHPAAVLVEGEQIRAIADIQDVPGDAQREDFGTAVLLPGLVDSHVHINEPGRTAWEGFATATQAAAAGGYTMLVDMPLNCVPSTTSVAALEEKRAAAEAKCHVDWGAWGGLVQDNRDQIEDLARAGVLGFKCFLIHPGIDEFTMVREEELRKAMPQLVKTGLPLLVHAELPAPIESATQNLQGADWRRYPTYLQSRPDDAELAAIRLMVSLCREYRFHLHIVHLSTAAALEILGAARAEGLPVTVETCPHYLHLESEVIPDGATQCKCAPPIRNHENRERLWQGLGDGLIDMIVTDHSPCPPEMKKMDGGNFRDAWGGIASLSLALPIVWTEAQQRGFSLSDVARWMSEEPARLAGCNAHKGKIAAGYDADFVVFHPEQKLTVTKDRLYHRHPISPYFGEQLHGVVERTYLRGHLIFQNGEFYGPPAGQEFRLNAALTSLS